MCFCDTISDSCLDVEKSFQKTEQLICHEGIAHLKSHFGRFETTFMKTV